MNDPVLAKVREFVAALLAAKGDIRSCSDSETLIESGRLDSLAVTEIVAFLEREFAVEFSVIEFDPDCFDSIEKIAKVAREVKVPA